MITVTSIAILAALLFAKHFVADGPLQTRNQLENKGTFLHVGGLTHAATHVAFSGLCILAWFLAFSPGAVTSNVVSIVALILLLEFVCHYLIDYAKANAERANNWSALPGPDSPHQHLVINDAMFFHAFLADQLLHNLTYIAMIALLVVWL